MLKKPTTFSFCLKKWLFERVYRSTTSFPTWDPKFLLARETYNISKHFPHTLKGANLVRHSFSKPQKLPTTTKNGNKNTKNCKVMAVEYMSYVFTLLFLRNLNDHRSFEIVAYQDDHWDAPSLVELLRMSEKSLKS